jgi:uncharacterized protein (DUF2147 family)
MHGLCRPPLPAAESPALTTGRPHRRRRLESRASSTIFRAAALLPMALILAGALSPGPSPVGYWLTEKHDAIVQIFRCGGDALCGKLAWFQVDADDPDPRDRNNPDPALRGRSLCGLMLISGFTAAGPDDWQGGAIYDPDNGNTYHATIKVRINGALDLHGYIGVPLLGRSETWTRYAQQPPACLTR